MSFINSADPDTVFSTNGMTLGERNDQDNQKKRPIFQYDIAGNIPAGATITAVTWAPYITNDASSNARTARLRYLKRDFVGSQVTWNSYSTGNAWQTAGGSGANDRDSTDLATRDFSASETLNQYKDFVFGAYGISVVQAWLDGGIANNGFMAFMDTEVDDAYIGGAWDSTPNCHHLIVEYTTPGSPSPSASTSLSPSSSQSPSSSVSLSPSATTSASPSSSPSASVSLSPSSSLSLSISLSFSLSSSLSISSSLSPSPSASVSLTGSPSSSISSSFSFSPSISISLSPSPSPSVSISLSESISASSSFSRSPSLSISLSISLSPSSSFSPSPSPAIYVDKYEKKNTMYTDKYEKKNNSFSDKYEVKNTSYNDKYEKKNTTFTDKYEKKNTAYTNTYREFD